MAWLCAVLVLAVTSLSAFIRLGRTDPGCAPWPSCQGPQLQRLETVPAPAESHAVTRARQMHRISASASLVVVLAMLAVSLRAGATLRYTTPMTAGLLVLALFLALLGVAGGASQRPIVTLGNLLGGFLMWGLSVRLALATQDDADNTSPGAGTAWIWLAGLLVLAQIALGGLVSATHAGLSCPAWGACSLDQTTGSAWNLWLEPAPGTVPTHAGGALVHLLHRLTGFALLVLLWWLAWRAARQARYKAATLLAAIPLLQVLLGMGIVAQHLPLAAVLTHNIGAALLLALLMGLHPPAAAPRARLH